MNKHNHLRNDGGPIPLDESWWAAVLAEEEEMGGLHPNRAGSNGEGKASSAHHAVTKPVPVDWEKARSIYRQDLTICLNVFGYNRGGLLVEGEGLQGFVPVSHLVDLAGEKTTPEHEGQVASMLGEYVGRSLRLKVIECEPERGRVVLSERAALAEPGKRNQLLDFLKPGDCVSGSVTNITDFGVFVDLGGVEGLIHVSELSWGRVRHPSDVASLGDDVDAYVIHIEKDRSRVALSLKRLRPNPWDTAEERYAPGQVIEAIVTSIVPFGAFARLEEGLDGLIHISEMGLAGKKLSPGDLLREGQKVEVQVLQVDASKQRLGLSLVSK